MKEQSAEDAILSNMQLCSLLLIEQMIDEHCYVTRACMYEHTLLYARTNNENLYMIKMIQINDNFSQSDYYVITRSPHLRRIHPLHQLWHPGTVDTQTQDHSCQIQPL